MIITKPLQNLLFETDPDEFYSNLNCCCTPWIDTCVVLHLIRRYSPKTFLEIGTHRGFTTRTLAEKFPNMQVVGVDPGDQILTKDRPRNQAFEYLSQKEIGECTIHLPNVTIIKKKIEEIEWGTQRFDMIFVDGDHRYSAVLRDSSIALNLLNSPGIIIWHDFNNVKDVNLALENLNLDPNIVAIPDTWIAYYSSHQ